MKQIDERGNACPIQMCIRDRPEEGDIYYVATTKDGKELSNEEALKIEE